MNSKIRDQIRKYKLSKIKINPVKLTALWYLKEALLEEKYEDCKTFIQIAKEFGAWDFEIKALLEDPRRNPLQEREESQREEEKNKK